MNQLALNHPRFAKRPGNRSGPCRMWRRDRNGLTLVELLIAVTLTLIIVGIMVRAFKSASDEISIGRARMDMQNQLRMVTETLRTDLQNATCQPRPRGIADERSGYFEIVEGPETDQEHFNPDTNSFIGDHDDVLALTVRSEGRPFRGRYNGGFVESYLAEIVWFVVNDGVDGYNGQYRLYRRVLLIRPDLAELTLAPAAFFEANDISARALVGDMVPNSLEDLADRRNRYAHNPGLANFPHELQNGYAGRNSEPDQFEWLSERVLGVDGGDGIFDPEREGEDLILDGSVGFDIKVFSPNAPVFDPQTTANLADSPPYLPVGFGDIDQVIEFSDPGFDDFYTNYDPNTYTGTDTGGEFVTSWPQSGGYVDLGANPITPWLPPPDDDRPYLWPGGDAWFLTQAYPGEEPLPHAYTWSANTYCTWWAGYEFDGENQDVATGDMVIDQGTNGVDDDGANGVDDNGERETPPPYAHPIRSVQISVRLIETKTNQVLQKTVKESFVPN